MTSIEQLLQIRKQIKTRKPEFIRQDTNKKKRLEKKWRKPKGIHSKLLQKLKGRPKSVSQGYRSPKKVRGLHKSGLKQVRISSLKELNALEPKKDCIILSSALGVKKKISILSKAKELGFNIVNLKSVEERIKRIQEKISLNKKDQKISEKEDKKEEQSEDVKKETISEKDKKEIEKKEMDTLLIKQKI